MPVKSTRTYDVIQTAPGVLSTDRSGADPESTRRASA